MSDLENILANAKVTPRGMKQLLVHPISKTEFNVLKKCAVDFFFARHRAAHDRFVGFARYRQNHAFMATGKLYLRKYYPEYLFFQCKYYAFFPIPGSIKNP